MKTFQDLLKNNKKSVKVVTLTQCWTKNNQLIQYKGESTKSLDLQIDISRLEFIKLWRLNKIMKLVQCRNCRNRKLGKDICKINNQQIDDLEKEIYCESYDSRYIEYPIEVSGIEHPFEYGIRDAFIPTGSLVKIKPCSDKYSDKTFIGIFIGEIDIGLIILHDRATKELSIGRRFNPAIFVPELKEVIFGCNSWWCLIKSENELKNITDDDIDNIWYVKLLKGMIEKE